MKIYEKDAYLGQCRVSFGNSFKVRKKLQSCRGNGRSVLETQSKYREKLQSCHRYGYLNGIDTFVQPLYTWIKVFSMKNLKKKKNRNPHAYDSADANVYFTPE